VHRKSATQWTLVLHVFNQTQDDLVWIDSVLKQLSASCVVPKQHPRLTEGADESAA
jgi:hypothetical protein